MYLIPEDGQCDQNMKHVLMGLGKFVMVDEHVYQFLKPCTFGSQINTYQAQSHPITEWIFIKHPITEWIFI